MTKKKGTPLDVTKVGEMIEANYKKKFEAIKCGKCGKTVGEILYQHRLAENPSVTIPCPGIKNGKECSAQITVFQPHKKQVIICPVCERHSEWQPKEWNADWN